MAAAAAIIVISLLTIYAPCSRGFSPTSARVAGHRRSATPLRLRDASPGKAGGIPDESFDVILSSGFLCFSRHAGFASALEDLNLRRRVDRYVGTSSGALAASMLAAGLTADALAEELSSRRPIAECRPSSRFWRGLLSTRALERRLRDIGLPETFEALPRPLAVGVYDVKTGEARLVSSGPLVPAVAASCAVPGGMFAPVYLGEGDDRRLYADGGKVDRTFIKGWREWASSADTSSSSSRRALVHLIRSEEDGAYSERDGVPDVREDIIDVVHSPRTKGGLFSLGDFEGERQYTRTVVKELLEKRLEPL